MKGKRIIGWVVAAVVAIVVFSVAFVAATVGSEASKLDSTMKQDLSTHLTADAVKQQLTSMGYEFPSPATAQELQATGPHHHALVYGTWLTLDVKLDADQKMTGYEIERASGWF